METITASALTSIFKIFSVEGRPPLDFNSPREAELKEKPVPE